MTTAYNYLACYFKEPGIIPRNYVFPDSKLTEANTNKPRIYT